MRTFVKTKSGSVYVVDFDTLRWERIQETPDSGPLRTDDGELSSAPKIKLGEPMILLGPPIVSHASGRVIMTTDVVEIRQEGVDT